MDRKDNMEAWVAFYENSGLTQSEFEAKHGIPGRTLRSWRQKLRGRRQPPADTVREAIGEAIAALAAVRDRLDSACQVGLDAAQVEARAGDQALPSCPQATAVDERQVDLPLPAVASAVANDLDVDRARRTPEDGAREASGEDATPAATVAPTVKARRRFFEDWP